VTTEGDQAALAAVLAGQNCEASAEQPAVEVALELAPHEHRQRGSGKAIVHRGVEGLQVLPHDPMQGAELGTTPLVGVRLASASRGDVGDTGGSRVGGWVVQKARGTGTMRAESESVPLGR